ncbi:uncharacterized protein [Porites lutea]|uniref:uncharacterized protein n=1 Tax=Porites lutea TaxID=51062 RepID=UPI003CC50433
MIRTGETANDLPHLRVLFKNSKASNNTAGDVKDDDADNDDGEDDENRSNDDDIDDFDKDNDSKSEVDHKRKVNDEPQKETRKRKALDTAEEESPKKKSKAACKYASKCYQRSEEHRQKFSHPKEDEVVGSPSKGQRLKDIFHGLTIFLSKDLEDHAKLKRYIIAYDGDLAKDLKRPVQHIL